MPTLNRVLGPNLRALTLSTLLILAITLPLHGQTTRLYLPALTAVDGADFRIALVNPTASDTEVTLTARTYGGDIIGGDGIVNPVMRIMPASSQIALGGAEVFGQGISSQTGWIELSMSNPGVSGFFEVFDAGLTFLDGAALSAAPSSRIIFPKVS